jgi:hypothetical protein
VIGLGTAYANGRDNGEKLAEVVWMVAGKIVGSKAIGLVEKCLIWVANEDKELVVTCGFFLLSCLLQAKDNLLNNTRKSFLSVACTKIL